MSFSPLSSTPQATDASSDHTTDKWKLIQEWQDCERKLGKACDQLDQLSDSISDLTSRLNRAEEIGNEGTVQYIKMKLQVVEGVRHMYYTYADCKAQRLNLLWDQMYDCPDFEEKDLDLDVEDDLLMLIE